ncbi:MAG: hypothetical protein ACE5EI_07875 [Thermodesulfobacteriota bacterium]
MKNAAVKPEKLERLIKDIIEDWFLHLDEYPHLYTYMAESLMKSGVVDWDNHGMLYKA